MSASCLISHLTVSDLNTNAAVYLCFLIIYGRHHFNHYSTIPFQRWSDISHCQSNLIHPWPSVTVHSTATAETEMCLRFSLKKGEDVVRIGAETLLFVQYLWAGFTAFCLEQYLEFFFFFYTHYSDTLEQKILFASSLLSSTTLIQNVWIRISPQMPVLRNKEKEAH